MARLKINLNDAKTIKDLLEEAYLISNEQLIQAQNEMNKMANATKLNEEVMDSRAKYGKIMNDYLSIKDKAISKKIEIAKLLTEILHHNGNSGGDAISTSMPSFDFKKIKEMVNDMHNDIEKTKTIELNKK